MKRKFLLTALSVLLAVAMLIGSMPAVYAYDLEPASPAFHITVTASPEAAIGGYFSLNRIPPGDPPVTNRNNQTEQTYAIKAGTMYRVYDVQPSINGLYFTCFIIDYPETLGRDDEIYHCSDIYLEAPASDFRVILVYSPNHAPVANPDAYTTNEDTPLTIVKPGVLANDTDADGNPLSAARMSDPAHGTVDLDTTGAFIYTPDANYNGTDSFTYKAYDDTAYSEAATVSITITPDNDSPVADDLTGDQSVTTDEDTPVAITLTGSDIEGYPLTFSVESSPAFGTLSGTAPELTYTPNLNYNGTDSFTFKVNDGTSYSDPATVDITINPVNDAPSFTAGPNQTINEDAGVQTVTGWATGLSAGPADESSQILTFNVTGNTNASLFAVAPVVDSAGTLTYTPAANANGSATITLVIKDNGGTDNGGADTSAPQSFIITVNPVDDAPFANSDGKNDAYTTNEDTPLTIDKPGVLANDTDVEGNTLTAIKASGPQHGELILNSDGSFTYTPTANFNGTDTFTYQATDGIYTSDTVTVYITINAVNDAPDVSDIPDQTIPEGSTFATIALDDYVSDVDNLDTEISWTCIGNTNLTVVITDRVASIAIPNADWHGTETLTFTATDPEGAFDSDPAVFTVTLLEDDAPVANADVYSTDEDTLLTITASGVLANDTDSDGNPLTAVKVTDPTYGLVTLNTDGSFTYTPNADYNGTDSFTYKVNDGTVDSGAATVTINVTPVNDAPVVAGIPDQTISEGSTFATIALDNYVSDVDNLDSEINWTYSGDTDLTVAINDTDRVASIIVPDADWHGTETIIFTATDPEGLSGFDAAVFTVTLVEDHAPVANNDTYSTDEDTPLAVDAINGVLANDTDADADGNPLTAVKVTDPVHGSITLNADGSFNYIPTTNYYGTDTFTYQATDGTYYSNIATADITINPVNDPPLITGENNNDTYSTNEDIMLTVDAEHGVLVNDGDADADGDGLTAVLDQNVTNGILTFNSDGSFTYTPNADYNGTDSFTYKVSDGEAVSTGSATVTINITPVNDVPSFIKGADQTIDEDAGVQTVTGWATGLSAGPANEASQTLVFNVTDNTNASLFAVAPVVDAAGTLTYTPAANANGSATITLVIKDNGGTDNSGIDTSAPQSFIITIKPVNDPPVAVDDNNSEIYTTLEDTALIVAASGVLANDTDVDGNTLTAIKVSDPGHGSITLEANGSFTYIPNSDFNGTDTFTYKVNDGTADSDVATVTINVTPVNDAPSFTAGPDQTINEDAGAQTVPGWASHISTGPADESTQILTFHVIDNADTGFFTVRPAVNYAGTLTYTPAANVNGSVLVTVTLSDNGGTADGGVDTSASQSFTITVNPIEDTPVANDQIGDRSVTTNEDIPVAITLTGSDADGDPLTYSVGTPSHGTLAGTAPALTYTPGLNYNGSDSFTFKVNDSKSDSAPATVDITIRPVNDAPVAEAKSATVRQDRTVEITLSATDVDSEALTYKILDHSSNVEHLTLNGNKVTYDPDNSFEGTDTFTYRAYDGNLYSDPATVTITVTEKPSSWSGDDDPVIKPTPTPDDGTDIEGDVNGEGRFLRTIIYWSPDKVCKLVVSVDTIGLDSELSPLKDIAILFKEGEIDPSVGMKALSLKYDFTPNGATLDPAGLLVFKYDDTLLPPGYPEDRLHLYIYDEATQSWVGLANAQLDPINNQFVYDLKTFGVMAIFYPYTPPEDSTDITGPAVTPPAQNLPVVAVSPTPKNPLPETPASNWWWIIGIVIAALAAAGLLFYMIRKNKTAA